MKWARVKLIVATTAFVAWIGYLIFVTQSGDRPSITLSRPQFLVAEKAVIAHVPNKNAPVIIQEVYPLGNGKIKAGDKLQVKNLAESLHKRLNDPNAPQWELPGDFIIPLSAIERDKDGILTAEVTLLPPSPGLPRGWMIYPVTPDTLTQLRSLPIGAR
jgi:hypothetical protein